MDKEAQASDIQAKLEEWRLKNGRPSKPEKPWVPRFKKLPIKAKSETETQVVNQPRALQLHNSQNSKSIMKSEVTKKVSDVKSKIDTNLSAVRREQLEEWKLKRKELEQELKENKDKERRWTIGGRRESILPLNNMKRLPFITSGVGDRSFVKPKANLVNMSLCIPPKPPMENNLTKKVEAPVAKVNLPKTQTSGKETQANVLNAGLKNINLPKSESAIKVAPAKALNPAPQNVRKVATSIFKNPGLPKQQVVEKVNPAKVVNNNLKNPKPQVVKKIVDPAKVANNNLSNPILPKPQNVKKKVDPAKVVLQNADLSKTESVNKEGSVKVAVKNLTKPRVSISSLHRKPTWKNGSKVVVKPSITIKKAVSSVSNNTPASNFNESFPQAEKKPWNPGTSLNRSFSIDITPGTATANISFVPGGILKKKKGLLTKSPKVKRNVNFAISPGSPEDAPLNERLVSWLLDNNQSPCEFRHLQCFGAALEYETLLPPVRSFDAIEEKSNAVNESSTEFETATIHSFDSTGTFIVENSGNMKANEEARVQKVVSELHALLLKSYPIAEASKWLDLIYEKSPEVSKMADYWLCRARIAMSFGAGVEDVLELIEQGIKHEAQPSKKLEDYKKKRTRPATPRIKKDEGKENIFDSTVVKFKVGELETGSKKEVKREDTPMRLTPVRRSHRISNFVNSEFDSIDEIPVDLKSRLVLTPNKFLDVDMEASNIDENVY